MRRLFVSVIQPDKFNTITDEIPACVQTRLDEFMAGPGRRYGVKVSYLKPICVEVDTELHFTSRVDIESAVTTIQDEAFAQYRRQLPIHISKQTLKSAARAALFVPRTCAEWYVNRRQKPLNDFRKKLEFQRRQTAHDATKAHRQCSRGQCSFDDMLLLTNPLETDDVVRQFGIERELSIAQQKELLYIATGNVLWFAAWSSILAGAATAITMAPLLAVCDPAFVAEFPDQPGKLWNIGHFDEIDGVRHVEI